MRPSVPCSALVVLFTLACGLPADSEGDAAGECADGADNDRNGDFDCDDEGCGGSPDCDDSETGDELPEEDHGLDELPDLAAGLRKESACEAGGPGATAFWGGELDLTGGSVSGTEVFYWFPNSALGGTPCRIQFEIFGQTTGCSGCDLRLQIDGRGAWNQGCPSGLFDFYGVDYSVTYEMDRKDQGRISLFFASGTFYADGFFSGDEIAYMSPYTCLEH